MQDGDFMEEWEAFLEVFFETLQGLQDDSDHIQVFIAKAGVSLLSFPVF